MFLTVLIESHAERSLCMQIHTLLSSISGGGGVVSMEGRAGVVVHELGDRFFLNVLTVMLSATQCLEQSFNTHVLYFHTQ